MDMIFQCVFCLGENIFVILAIIISCLSLVVAYFSLLTNSEPVIAYLWDNDNDYKHYDRKCYYIKNVGKGPAMNIIVSYVNDSEDGKSVDWKNPVRCYSLEPNGEIYIDWGLKSGGKLFLKDKDKNTKPDYFLDGVPKIGTVYSSSNFFCKRTYTSICEHDTTKIKNGNQIREWSDDEVCRIWNLERRPEKEK